MRLAADSDSHMVDPASCGWRAVKMRLGLETPGRIAGVWRTGCFHSDWGSSGQERAEEGAGKPD